MNISLEEHEQPVDPRPEISPYTAALVTLRLEDGAEIKIHSTLLNKCPRLRSLSSKILKISRNVGHTVVHCLLTGKYECLKPKGSSSHEKVIAEFESCVRVYSFAREIEWPLLEELARCEIERLGDKLQISTIHTTLPRIYPELKTDDEWFRSYLKSRLQSALLDMSELVKFLIPNPGSKSLSVSDVFFNILVELISEPASQLQDSKKTAFVDTGNHQPASAPPYPEQTKSNEDFWSKTSNTKKDKRKTKVVEPEIETELVKENTDWCGSNPSTTKIDNKKVAEVEPEPEPLKDNVDAFWPIAAITKKDKKKKKIAESEPEPEPEPAKDDGDDFWSFSAAKKDKKKVAEPVPEPEPVKDNVDAFWPIATITKKDKKKKKVAEPEPEPEPEPAKDDGDDFWSFLAARKDKKKVAEPVPEPEPVKDDGDDFWPSPVTKTDNKKRSNIANPKPAITEVSMLPDGGWLMPAVKDARIVEEEMVPSPEPSSTAKPLRTGGQKN